MNIFTEAGWWYLYLVCFLTEEPPESSSDTFGDQYSQIPCAAHKAKLDNLKSYAVYFGIEGGDDHNPLNAPEVPQPPRSDPARMFIPGTYLSLQQEHYANLGKKLSIIMEKCTNNSWQLGEVPQAISEAVLAKAKYEGERLPASHEWRRIHELLKDNYIMDPCTTSSAFGANIPTNGATSSIHISSPSSSLCTNPNSRSNLPSTQATNLSSSSDRNNSRKSNCPNNLDVALQAFIQRFVPSDSANVGQILQGITRNAESVWKSNTSQTVPHTTPTSSTAPSMTVVHKLDQFTENLVKENMKLREENEVLKAQIATLKSTVVENTDSPSISTPHGARASLSPVTTDPSSVTTSTPHSARARLSPVTTDPSTSTPHGARAILSPVTPDPLSLATSTPHSGSARLSPVTTDPSSLTTEEINQFNKLPKDLKEFYEQMLTGRFSCEVYSKCSSTKSVFTKRKLVFKYIREYPTGIEKFYDDFSGKSPTWIYNNVVRCKRNSLSNQQ